MFDQFRKHSFLANVPQGFWGYMHSCAYHVVEESVKEPVPVVLKRAFPYDANIISSRVIYKVKIEDSNKPEFKGQIATHGKNESQIQNAFWQPNLFIVVCTHLGVHCDTIKLATIKRRRKVLISTDRRCWASGMQPTFLRILGSNRLWCQCK